MLTGKSILVTENLPVPKVHHDKYRKNAEVNRLQTSDKIIQRRHGLGLHPKRRKNVVKTLRMRDFVPINRKSTLREHLHCVKTQKYCISHFVDIRSAYASLARAPYAERISTK